VSSRSNEPIVAAGCVVTRGSGADAEVLLVHRPKYDDWSLPKGKQEPKEHVLATAVREVFEESGLVVALRRPLPSREYVVDSTPKAVHYWRAQVEADEGFTPNKEVDEIAWLPVADAVRRATHPLDAELAAMATQPAGTPFLLLRHGKATKRASWDGADLDRPMDAVGFEQADELVPLIGAYGVRRVHSSAARRCMTTVQPYADRHGLPLVPERSLSEEGFLEDPVAALERAAGLLSEADRSGEPVVVCGHRPNMPALLAHLLEESGIVGPTDAIPVASFVAIHVAGGVPIAAEQHFLD
jgi:8-oxo-dGTP diphosphatase